ncbi:hypothetical protein PZE06_17895 [Robertmurraya sp. DFI.2.37]|uniref:hypothetical protein n=1 Tax=Robertmurraya sp. DFI.2.37 TaxID=3031819 RepID=UPI0023DB7A5D|nr:hypothetical protein [Robertmurraya sp. DFI.2.37]MDF1510016.1 hypothetical protein [Robertmurraya sp. DFI.2.37]
MIRNELRSKKNFEVFLQEVEPAITSDANMYHLVHHLENLEQKIGGIQLWE